MPDKPDLSAVLTEDLEAELSRRMRDAVRPVHEVCNAFRIYVRALQENESNGPFDPEAAEAIRKYGEHIITFAHKSNLLGRLIYDRQPLRTKKCPEHDGHWSGCWFDRSCECQSGYDVTGWLP